MRRVPLYLQNGICGCATPCAQCEEGNSSQAVLPLTNLQNSIHCESSHVVHGACKWKWVPLNTHSARVQTQILNQLQLNRTC